MTPRPSRGPADSSATMAPITLAEAAIFKEVKRKGSALGNRSFQKVCVELAAYERMRSRLCGETARKPRSIPIVTGKKDR